MNFKVNKYHNKSKDMTCAPTTDRPAICLQWNKNAGAAQISIRNLVCISA